MKTSLSNLKALSTCREPFRQKRVLGALSAFFHERVGGKWFVLDVARIQAPRGTNPEALKPSTLELTDPRGSCP